MWKLTAIGAVGLLAFCLTVELEDGFRVTLSVDAQASTGCGCTAHNNDPLCACDTGIIEAHFGPGGETCNAQKIASAESCCGINLDGIDGVSKGLFQINVAVHCRAINMPKSFFCPYSGVSTPVYATAADCKSAMRNNHNQNTIAACSIREAWGSWSPWSTEECADCANDPSFCNPPRSCTCPCPGWPGP